VEIRGSERGREPALTGIFHPIITVPRGLFEALTESEFEAVLLHELAHARRHDNLASALAHALVCLFWFHPLLWFVEKRLIAERERACDEAVMASGIAPKTYLAGILKVCRFHVAADVAGVSTMNGSALNRRSDLILAYRTGNRCHIRFALPWPDSLCWSPSCRWLEVIASNALPTDRLRRAQLI
jgi:beta-lactamase regulating signal transducer with metallopeptidase domain